jgi:hypothetical protein
MDAGVFADLEADKVDKRVVVWFGRNCCVAISDAIEARIPLSITSHWIAVRNKDR